MASQGVLVALDWGTTNVRAALLDSGGCVLDERRGESGVGKFTKDQFAARFDELTKDWPHVPAIAAGMVGSRQGWHEAEYIACPTGLDGLSSQLATFEHGANAIAIVPGLTCVHRHTEHDVMRGEETQIAGLLAMHPDYSGTLVLPGTHSKWVRLEKGRIVHFQTYMTGDLFDALSKHTILRHSMEDEKKEWCDNSFAVAFGDIFHDKGSDLSRLFPVRGDQLVLGNVAANNRRERLSGLLIGMEFAAAQTDGFDVSSLAIIGTGELVRLYEIGAEHLQAKCTVHRGTNLIWPALFNLANQANLLEASTA